MTSQRVFVVIRIPSDGTSFRGCDLISVQQSSTVLSASSQVVQQPVAAASTSTTQAAGSSPPGTVGSSGDPGIAAAVRGSRGSITQQLVEEKPAMAELTYKAPLPVKLSLVMSKLGITWAYWITSACGRFYEIHFAYEGGFKCEELMNEMTSLGIGTTRGTSFTCIPVLIHRSVRVANAPTEKVDAEIRIHQIPARVIQPGENAGIAGTSGELIQMGTLSRRGTFESLSQFQQQQPPPTLPKAIDMWRPMDLAADGDEYLLRDVLIPGDDPFGSDDVEDLPNIPKPPKKSKLRDFLKTIRSRLTVQEVLSVITEATKITFDYVCLVILASIIAAVGLITNSSVIIVASMLISPLMGPIIAIVFAAVIKDYKLLKKGFRAEFVGIIVCLVIGFAIGILDTLPRAWKLLSPEYPTDEMCNRGQFSGLVTGVMIALPSGAGVAISVLGGNVGSLVGVAISASLLPPAVNCGVLFGYAFIVSVGFKPEDIPTNLTHDVCCLIEEKDSPYRGTASTLSRLAATAGSVSFLLTIINIFCIIFVGVIVLKIKQVAPMKTFADAFWKEDVKTAQEYYKTIEREDATRMKEEYLRYLTNITKNAAEGAAGSTQEQIQQLADNLTTITRNLNTVSRNVYRFGPTKSIVDEPLPGVEDFQIPTSPSSRRRRSRPRQESASEIGPLPKRFQVSRVTDQFHQF